MLSLPSGQIQHFYKFIPARDKYTLLVVFQVGNNLYNGTDYPEADIEEISNDLVEIENKFKTFAKKMFVIGIPPHGICQTSILKKFTQTKKWTSAGNF